MLADCAGSAHRTVQKQHADASWHAQQQVKKADSAHLEVQGLYAGVDQPLPEILRLIILGDSAESACLRFVRKPDGCWDPLL